MNTTPDMVTTKSSLESVMEANGFTDAVKIPYEEKNVNAVIDSFRDSGIQVENLGLNDAPVDTVSAKFIMKDGEELVIDLRRATYYTATATDGSVVLIVAKDGNTIFAPQTRKLVLPV